jgi:hypothetical protein
MLDVIAYQEAMVIVDDDAVKVEEKFIVNIFF